MIVCLLAIVVLLAYILYKTSELDFMTALFACSPAARPTSA
jgi:uncharacterized membrane protein AbrB (regulator of aidB expression)